MQTLRASCSKAEPKNFRPATDPLPGGTGRPKFNQLEMVWYDIVEFNVPLDTV